MRSLLTTERYVPIMTTHPRQSDRTALLFILVRVTLLCSIASLLWLIGGQLTLAGNAAGQVLISGGIIFCVTACIIALIGLRAYSRGFHQVLRNHH